MPVILDAQNVRHRNDSGYVLNVPKLQARPPGVEETDGYREDAEATTLHHTRVYLVPWSLRLVFREWAVGYSFIEPVVSNVDVGAIAAALAAGIDYYSKAPPDPAATLSPIVAWNLRRVIPAQDPDCPWLFAGKYEVMDGKGAWIEDLSAFVLDADGNTVGTGQGFDFVPLRTGQIAYVNQDVVSRNSAGGMGSAGASEVHDGMVRVRITYLPRPYSVLDDGQTAIKGATELGRYVTFDEEWGIEALPLGQIARAGRLTFVTGFTDPLSVPPNRVTLANPAGPGGIPIPEAGIQQLPTSTIRLTWHDVPARPLSAYSLVVGRINANPFPPVSVRGSPIYAAQTLLCLPWKTRQTQGVTGQVTYQIQYSFAFRPTGWNRYPTAFGGFFFATFGGKAADQVVYQLADFGPLFKVPPPVRYL